MKAIWTVVLFLQTLVRVGAPRRPPPASPVADELAKVVALKLAGVIDEKGYAELKAKPLA